MSVLLNMINGAIRRIKSIGYNPYARFGINSFKLKVLKHQLYNAPGQIRIGGVTVSYRHPAELLHSLREIYLDDVYRLSVDSPSPLFIDGGANVGLSAIRLKMQYPNARIMAFEPDKMNYELLEANVSTFSGVELFNMAIWKEEGYLDFEMSGTQSSKLEGDSAGSAVQKIPTFRLRDFLAKEKVDFLKLDIEGAEYDVLTDCRHVLKYVNKLFVEYHGSFSSQYQLNEIFNLLTEAGFSYYIKEADNVHPHPLAARATKKFDIQLNIFAFQN